MVSRDPSVADTAGLAARSLFARLKKRQTAGASPHLVAV